MSSQRDSHQQGSTADPSNTEAIIEIVDLTAEEDYNMTPFEVCKKNRVKNPVLPKLAHWSDVACLQWHTATRHKTPVPNLRSVDRDHVVNSTTVQVVKAILSKREEWTPDGYVWHRPRYMFTPESDDFKALLGTPHGAGVAYLLIQHKEILGHRVVQRVEVVKIAGDGLDVGYLRIVFYIAGVGEECEVAEREQEERDDDGLVIL
jgi:hypothetical protein